MQNIFAIIVIYNGLKRDWIQKCFNSLLESSVKINIIAVDNVSTDGSVEFIEQNYPSVELIKNETNQGFGQANNIGIEKALKRGGEFFFLLNQDAWTEKRTVEILVENSLKNPQYGILSPLHMNGQGNLIDQGFYNCIDPRISRKLYSTLYLHDFDEGTLLQFKFVPAAAWLLPKNTILNIGGFSPTFFHYGEDDNYVHRVLYHNLKIGVVPAAKIYHDREERPPHIYFDDTLIKYERKIILDISNPLLKGNRKVVEYRLLLANLFRALIFFDRTSIKRIYNQFKRLIKIKTKVILANKEISEKQKKAFLS